VFSALKMRQNLLFPRICSAGRAEMSRQVSATTATWIIAIAASTKGFALRRSMTANSYPIGTPPLAADADVPPACGYPGLT